MSSMRTPLAKVKGLGSAKVGIHHWWLQRLTALANIPLTLVTVWIVLASVHMDYAGIINLIGHPCVGAILILFIASIFYHAALGLQVVVEDYVHGAMKMVMLILVKFLCAVLAVIGIISIIVVIVARASGS